MTSAAPHLEVDEPLVRALLATQHPDLAELPLQPAATGWDNVLYRLGDDLAVRLPTRELAAPLIRHEQRWLPVLAPTLPLRTPVPVRVGEPGCGYPWPWIVTPWIPGDTALAAPPADLVRTAEQLGAFLRALHREAPADAPPNPFRGGPLASRSRHVDGWLASATAAQLGAEPEVIAHAWARHVSLPRWDGPRSWLHGDVHPLNLIVDHGELVAVIDFGDVTAGDPAADLAIAWSLFSGPSRDALRASCGHDDATWARGRGWALCLGLAMALDPSPRNVLQAVGRATIAAALADGEAPTS